MSQFRPEWILVMRAGCAALLLAGCGEEGMEASPPSGSGSPPIQAPVAPAPPVPAPEPFIEQRPQSLAAPPPGFYSRFVCLDVSGFGSLRSYVLGDGSIWTSYGEPFCIYGPVWYEDGVSGFWQGHLDYAGAKSAADVRIFGAGPAVAATLDIGFGGAPAKLYSDLQLASGGAIHAGGAAAGEGYAQQRPAELAVEAGDWRYATFIADGHSANGNGLPYFSFRVSPDGGLRADLKGECTATGRMLPHPYGDNVFEITLTFGPGSCSLAGQNLQGIAAPLRTQGAGNILQIMAVDPSRTHSLMIDLWR